jgi:hypothetical protein
MTVHLRSGLVALAAVLGVAQAGPGALSRTAAPIILSFTINDGAMTTTSDAVVLKYSILNPSDYQPPWPHYRLRTKSPLNILWPEWSPYLPNDRGIREIATHLSRRNDNTSVAGQHLFEIQVKDADGQESNVMTRAITRIIPPPPPATVEYAVTGAAAHDLVRFARNAGFAFEPVPKNAFSACAVSDQSSGVWFTTTRKLNILTNDPARCQFRFFQYKPLRPGWSLKTVGVATGLVGQGATFEMLQQPGSGTNAACMAEGVAPPTNEGFTVSGYVQSVVLVGPTGLTWQKAFVP